jgi:hypothetical protein
MVSYIWRNQMLDNPTFKPVYKHNDTHLISRAYMYITERIDSKNVVWKEAA